MRGRPAKPIALRLVQGNPGHRPIPEELPAPKGIPAPPAHLSVRARQTWDKVAPLLTQMGVLTLVDGIALERLVCVYADILDAEDTLLKFGSRYQTSINGKTGESIERLHPAVGDLADADRRLKQWLGEFGMTPASRARISLKPNGEVDADGAEERYFGRA